MFYDDYSGDYSGGHYSGGHFGGGHYGGGHSGALTTIASAAGSLAGLVIGMTLRLIVGVIAKLWRTSAWAAVTRPAPSRHYQCRTHERWTH